MLIRPTDGHPAEARSEAALRLDEAVERLADAAERASGSAAPDIAALACLARALAHETQRRLDALEHETATDELTGVLNRRGFAGRLEEALAAARRYGETGVLILVDLDDFKPVNDRLGHAAGDTALRHMATLLADNVRDTDHVGRLGGDEFAVLLTRTPRELGLQRAEAIARMLDTTVFRWDGRSVRLRASVGFQAYAAGDTAEHLLACADRAMYATKRLRASQSGRRAA